jgi:hypothetical protein
MADIHRVAVTGLGVVAPSGIDARQMFGRLASGESFIQLHTIDQPPRPVTQPAIHCAGFNAEASIGKALAGTTDRSVQTTAFPGGPPSAARAPGSGGIGRCGRTGVTACRPCPWCWA